MIALDKRQTKTMVAVHGWSGILLGLLLYAVVLTGTAAVFAEEIGAWSSGHTQSGSVFEQPIDAAVRRLAARTPEKYHDDINIFEIGDRRLGVFFHRHELEPDGTPVDNGIYYQIDGNGQVAKALHGTSEEVFGPRNDDALSSFLVDTHVRLHVPNPWGLILTGIVGLVLLVAAISGLLIHRHLFRDIFTLRRKSSAALADRDRHSVAGTWSLPFAFVLAFTGSFFSFFGTVGVPVVAAAAFGGNVQALSEAIFGLPGKADPAPRNLGNLDGVMADAISRTGAAPTFAIIEKFGRADATVTTFHPPAASRIDPVTLLYNGATGAFQRVKPSIGAIPSVGGTLSAIMAPLHFGNFAGLASKAAWFGLGFAMCYVIYTGLRLWIVRRRADARSLDWLERTLIVVAFGLPFALGTCAAAFFLAVGHDAAVYWTPAGFLAGCALAIATGALCRTPEALVRVLQGGTGAVLGLLIPLRLAAADGPGWWEAIRAGSPVIVGLDLVFMLSAAWLLGLALRSPGLGLKQGGTRAQAAQA